MQEPAGIFIAQNGMQAASQLEYGLKPLTNQMPPSSPSPHPSPPSNCRNDIREKYIWVINTVQWRLMQVDCDSTDN